jgi:iron complex transport system ATP-binding protein
MLEARALGHARQGRWLVEGVDLKLPAGALVALLGPNGAGKSTLLRLLSGEWAPSRGEVWLGGKPLRAYTPRELALVRAFLPQHRGVAFPYTAQEVVALGRLPYGKGPREEERVAWALAQTGALHLAHRPYPSLSGGERARVDLARILAQETPILLLDEPTNHLDPKQQMEVMALCRRLARKAAWSWPPSTTSTWPPFSLTGWSSSRGGGFWPRGPLQSSCAPSFCRRFTRCPLRSSGTRGGFSPFPWGRTDPRLGPLAPPLAPRTFPPSILARGILAPWQRGRTPAPSGKGTRRGFGRGESPGPLSQGFSGPPPR